METLSFELSVSVNSLKTADVILHRMEFMPSGHGVWYKSAGFSARVFSNQKGAGIKFKYDDDKPARGRKPKKENIEKMVKEKQEGIVRQLRELFVDNGINLEELVKAEQSAA